MLAIAHTSASTTNEVPSRVPTSSDNPVTTKNSGKNRLPTSSIGRTTSASGVPSALGIVRPARNPPKTGCRPSDAVTHALPSASAKGTGN